MKSLAARELGATPARLAAAFRTRPFLIGQDVVGGAHLARAPQRSFVEEHALRDRGVARFIGVLSQEVMFLGFGQLKFINGRRQVIRRIDQVQLSASKLCCSKSVLHKPEDVRIHSSGFIWPSKRAGRTREGR